MSYHCGILGALQRLAAIGLEPREPHVKCDGCGAKLVVSMKRGGPPKWHLDGQAPPGWRKSEVDGRRHDECPRCVRQSASR